ncbi:MAG: Lrp/AsnC family transcriptional regulator [Candidatus Aenigmatarchaeota archaeon]
MLSRKYAKILEVLIENSGLPIKEISRRTGIPITTVHNRIKKMEQEGIIKCYKAIIDTKKIGMNIQAFLQITAKELNEEKINKIASLPNVNECYILSGPNDVLLKVSAEDIDKLNDFTDKQLRTLDWIRDVVTYVIMKNVK